MPFVKCGVNGCNKKLQPILKVDPRDRDTWFYPECDACLRPVCDEHSAEVGGRVLCDLCRKEIPEAEAPPLLDLCLGRLSGSPPASVASPTSNARESGDCGATE